MSNNRDVRKIIIIITDVEVLSLIWKFWDILK
jgi:hypothetical protein